MINAIKAEFRKLLTVRSTYVIVVIGLLLELIFAFWVNGYKASPEAVRNQFFLSEQVSGAVLAVSLLGALVGILLMTHEYRYNTIMYTLTLTNSRSKALLAKVIAVSVFAITFTVIMAVMSPLLAYLGAQLAGLELGSQTIYYSSLIWRTLFFGWAYVMVGLLFATLIRSQVGTIVAIFLLPGIIEELLTLVLKEDSKYLPFRSLAAVLENGAISHEKGALLFCAYLLGGWLVAWLLFLRRDAN
jgi:ABC-type transport system involved in multi-copper enzyme maturation permease subunit